MRQKKLAEMEENATKSKQKLIELLSKRAGVATKKKRSG